MRNLCLLLLIALLWGCNIVKPEKPVKKYAVYYEYNVYKAYIEIDDKDGRAVYWITADTTAADTIYIPLD